ncbi:MAG: acyl-CoA mutase large subunit family protein [Anaerolineae bacterium]
MPNDPSVLERELAKRRQDAFEDSPIPPAQTDSGIPLDVVYTPSHVQDLDYLRDLGLPGEMPFTRGIYPSMYRGRLWTMRLYSGMATPEDSNERYRYLLQQGQTGLSVAFDLPTQIGLDSDHPIARHEVGRVGVAIDTLADMEALFKGIPLDKVSTSFTINATAPIIMAMYVAAAEKQGLAPAQLRGTLQNDILKEYLSRKTYIFPPGPSLRLAADLIEYCTREVPKFNPISVCGYHMRQAGCNAPQEVALALSNALVYMGEMVARGLGVDDFAPRFSFNFSTCSDFFEEIAKHRACRRLWARLVQERFHPQNPRSCTMRFFSGGDGTALTATQLLVNIVRATVQCMAILLGGAQAVHTVAYDEALGIPTEESALVALRTQQVLAYESGIPKVADPLGGSYYVEWLTNQIEAKARQFIDKIESTGGMLRAIEDGWIERLITRQAYERERQIQSGERPIVGVNLFAEGDPQEEVRIYRPGPEVLRRQLDRLAQVKASRHAETVAETLAVVREVARGDDNLMPAILNAARAYATVGEITDALKTVFGEYRAPGFL